MDYIRNSLGYMFVKCHLAWKTSVPFIWILSINYTRYLKEGNMQRWFEQQFERPAQKSRLGQ